MLPLLKEIKLKLIDRFQPYGYKRSANLSLKKKHNDIVYYISFGVSHNNEKGVSYLAPKVLLKSISAYKLIERLSESLVLAGIFKTVGYLMPEHTYKEWRFEVGNSQNDANFEDMVNSICTYGLPFIEQFTDNKKIIDYLIDKDDVWHNEALLPCLYYLEGRKDLALSLIDYNIKEMEKRHILDVKSRYAEGTDPSTVVDEGLAAYMPFVEKFRKLCTESDK